MITYAQIVDKQTKLVVVGTGTDSTYYKSIGMTQMDVEQAYNGAWYVKGYAPAKPEPTIKEQVLSLEQTYGMTRWQREGILAEGSLYSEYTKSKAQEIEDLAKELRATEESSATGKETLQVEEMKNVN